MSQKEKSGAEKRKDKARRDLLDVANQPGQKKICFPQIHSGYPAHDSVEDQSLDPNNASVITSVTKCSQDMPIDPNDRNDVQLDLSSIEPHHQKKLDSPDAEDDQSMESQEPTTEIPNTSCVIECPKERQAKLDHLSLQPHQPTHHIPFSVDIYHLKETDGSIIQRKWLTYIDRKLYCRICCCFSVNRENDFVLGVGEDHFRRASQLVKRHEVSQNHREASDCYFRNLRGGDIDSFIPGWRCASETAAYRKVEHNRQVLARIIDVVKLVAGQGLPYRGESESARDLLDTNKHHGNFLETVLLLSKYDSVLSNHVAQCFEKGQKQGKGRGNTTTFLSKTTVNNIIKALAELIQEKIVMTINEESNRKYGIMMYGTVDISGTDQLNIVARFVGNDGKVQERLLGFEVITSGKGKDLWKLLVGKLEGLGIDIKTLIGLSLDGASANTSENVGVVKYYNDEVPGGYFVWGIAHQQNLVVSPVLSEIKEPRNLMGLLQQTCSFFNESSRRMDVWKKWVEAHSRGSKKLTKMVKLGKTRWWSAYKAILQLCDDPQRYFILLGSLWDLSTSEQSSSATKRLSDGLLSSYLNFNSLLTATVLKKVLAIFNPVTKYLQTRGMHLNQAIQMVEYEQNVLLGDRSKFDRIFEEASTFRLEVQELVDANSNQDFDITLQETLPKSAITRKRRRFFDEANDERVTTDPKEQFRLNAFLPIVDRLNAEISTRFNERNTELYSELSCLHPCNYEKLTDSSAFSMRCLAQLSDVDEQELKEELIHFAQCHRYLGEPVSSTVADDSDSDEDPDDPPFCKGNCSRCLACILMLLVGYRFQCRSYNKLYSCIKVALTLPCTVVSCERIFSKLRYVKSRLRSLLGQDLLEALLLCTVEVDILKSLDNECVLLN